MRRITIVPAQIRRQRDMSLRQRALIGRAEHAVSRMYRRIRTRRRRHVQSLMHHVLVVHQILVRDDWRPGHRMALTQQRRITRRAVQRITRAPHGGLLLLLLQPQNGTLFRTVLAN